MGPQLARIVMELAGWTGLERERRKAVRSPRIRLPRRAVRGAMAVPNGARSRPFTSRPRPFETVGSKIGDAELVNAAARATLDGRGELAEFLMREARQRRESAPQNVVPIQSKRP